MGFGKGKIMLEEKENQFILEGAKLEYAYADYLVKDMKSRGESWEETERYLREKGWETNNHTFDEYDNHIQVDLLGAYCGITLVDNGEGVFIGYCWAFDEKRTELCKGGD